MKNFNQFKELFEYKNSSLVCDGLIYSYSHSKFSEKLTNILNKYGIRDYEIIVSDEGVFLTNFKPIKDKYLFSEIIRLLNLSGYYISSYKNDNKLITSSLGVDIFMNSTKLDIVFNKNFDFEDTGIKLILYHVTDFKFINKIKKQGLIVKSNKMLDNHPERIYLFDSINDMEGFIINKSFYEKDFNPVRLKIDVKTLPKLKLYKDPKYPSIDAYYTYDNIPSYSINIIN
jgi:hypothetical protein